MSIIHTAGIQKHSFVDGEGIRFVIFTQGCIHACPSCHNPETWACEGGTALDTSELIAEMLATRFLDGITLSGGDPLLQAEASFEIARAAREAGLNVWMYTGWTWEALLQGKVPHVSAEEAREGLSFIDVLVDGRFIASRAYEHPADEAGVPYWRGSSNQRLIDVPKSLRAGQIVGYVPDTQDRESVPQVS
ncbi:MAG: anaerobic ribonucleoside-triphosphate reductase activating protein [Lachnospiraceae bacterium]|nr:anaerobic ribonucleoside-triphosphate reductase activating protein [Lachnospiraceae bacterium]